MSDPPSELVEVLLVVDSDTLRRLGKLPRLLCVGMVDEPVRVTVLHANFESGMDDFLGPARMFGLPRRIWPWHQWTTAEIEEEFELEPPHIVHCMSPALAGWVQEWAREWESRLIVQLTDGVDVDEFCELDLPEQTIVTPISETLSRMLLQRVPAVQPWTRVIPLGLPARPEPLCFAQPDRVPAVIVTVPLTRDSGVDRVLRALQAIVQAGQEVQLFLLSTGPAEHYLRGLVEKLGIVKNVTFTGPMRDWSTLEEAMQGADFYMMPNIPPRYTITRLAALAGGLAVLAPVGSVEDYLIHGTTACLFDPQRPGQLTDCWIQLLEDRAAARDLARRALEYVRVHRQANGMITAIANLYRELRGWPAAESSTAGNP